MFKRYVHGHSVPTRLLQTSDDEIRALLVDRVLRNNSVDYTFYTGLIITVIVVVITFLY